MLYLFCGIMIAIILTVIILTNYDEQLRYVVDAERYNNYDSLYK